MTEKIKLIRITTVPISLQKLLQGQPQYMMQNGIEVVLASADGKEIPEIEKSTGLKVKILPLTRKITPLTDLKALWLTYKLIRKEKPDIVHTHTPKAGTIGMLAAKLAGVPIRMHTVAGLPLMVARGFKRKILNFVEKLTYSCATRVYPNSFGLKKIILDNKFLPEKKCKVIAKGSSNGIDTGYFNPEHFSGKEKEKLRKELNINDRDVVFIFVGRLVGDKGINELVTAFNQLNEKHKHIKLLLVGPYENELDPLLPETIRELKHNKNIITTGFQQDVRPYFAISDVLVFPSYREGLPNVVLQAGAMGLPAIVTDINGSNEIIINGENGLIITVKSVEALEKAMLKLLNEHQLRESMAEKARPIIENKYKREVVWQALLEEYRRLYQAYYS